MAAGTYLDGQPVPRTGDYQCLGMTPDGHLCPSVRRFERATGSKFTRCLKRHKGHYLKWMGPVPLSETDSCRLIGGEWT